MRTATDKHEGQTESRQSEVALFGWSRREFLTLLGSSSAAALLAACESRAPSSQTAVRSARPTELTSLSASALARDIRTKKVSAEEVINAYLQRIEAINPKINAI